MFAAACAWLAPAQFAMRASAQATSGSVVVAPIIATYAGNGGAGYVSAQDGGAASSAELWNPTGVGEDSAGNLYIADALNNRIRIVAAGTGIIATLAGDGAYGFLGDGGPATSAEVANPNGAAVDGAGNVYIADTGNNRIRVVAAATGTLLGIGVTAGNIYTVAGGGGTQGTFSGDGGAGTSAELNSPTGVAVDAAGDVYIADTGNNVVRMVKTGTGTISTVAGNNASPAGYGGDSGAATSGQLSGPFSVALDSAGNLYIADTGNDAIRMVAASAETMFAGTLTTTAGYIYTVAGMGGMAGASGDGGSATLAKLRGPDGVAVDGAGNLYIADTGNNVVREVAASTDLISAWAGDGTSGFAGDGGAAANGELAHPWGVWVDGAGNLYIGDSANNRIREASIDTTLPTTVVGATSASQVALVELTTASAISGISVPTAQNGAQEFTAGSATGCNVGSGSNSSGAICAVPITFSPQYPGPRTGQLTVSGGGAIIGTVGLSGMGTGPLPGFFPGTVSTLAGSGSGTFADGTGAAASFYNPQGVAVDAAGNVYVADQSNQRIRKIAAGGIVTTLAGSGAAGSADGAGAAAQFYNPIGLAVDGAGNVYVADNGNNRIRTITPAGVVATLAGNSAGYADGAGTSALFRSPSDVAVDGAGNVYVADNGNNRIRKIVGGVVTTLAGSGSPGYANGTGSAASFQYPFGVAVDGAGNVYVADYANERIRKITAAGVVSTLAGSGSSGQSDGAAGSATFSGPTGIAVDAAGNVYVSDHISNGNIRKVTAAGAVTTLAGNGFYGYKDGAGKAADFYSPNGIALDGAGNLYVADQQNNRVREIAAAAIPVAFATTTDVGSTDTADGAQTVTLANNGNAGLTFPAPSVAGELNPSIPASFSYGGASTCSQIGSSSSAFTLAAGASCTALVSFAPVAAGSIAGSLLFSDLNAGLGAQTQSVPLSGNAAQGSQTITFPQPTTPLAFSPGLTEVLAATSNSGLPLTYTVTSGPAMVSGSTLSISGAGTVVVAANQAGNANYSAATAVSRTIVVQQGAPGISWTPSTSTVYTGNPIGAGVLDATSGTSGSFAYTATQSGGSAAAAAATTVLAAGTYTLTANFTPTDTADYTGATATLPFTVAVQHILVVNSNGSVSELDDGGAAVNSSATSGGGVGIAIDNGGNIWSLNQSGDSLTKFTKSVGVASSGHSGGGLSAATALAIDGNGQVWAANGNGSVSLFSSSGAPLTPSAGYTGGGMDAPSGIAIDNSGNVWVSNSAGGAGSVTEILGGAAPVAPLAEAVADNSLGAKP